MPELEYLKTHPHLSFHIDLSRAPYNTWMLLGEARSKCEHIAGVPLDPNVAKELHQVALVKGAQATTAIEGNTLSQDEVRMRLEGRLDLPPSKSYMGVEIDNILKGFHLLLEEMDDPNFEMLTVDRFKRYNGIVLAGLALDDGVTPGEFPYHRVGVGNYLAPPREDCEYLLGRLCDWLNRGELIPADSLRIPCGIIRAILAHLYLAWIHPFGDGNGRTARLVELQILLAAGFPTAAAHLLSNHYDQTRSEYYRQLDRSSKEEGMPWQFTNYALRGLVDGLKAQLDTIRGYQHEIIWRNYIYEQFRAQSSTADRRRRTLILALSELKDPVSLLGLRTLSPDVALAYNGKTTRTIRRDVAELLSSELIRLSPAGMVANKELILQFLPKKRHERDRSEGNATDGD